MPWHLGTGIACKVVGWEQGQKGRQEARRKGGQSAHRASPPEMMNNGREGSRELGSAGDTTGHAPVACALLLPEPGRLPPADTCLPAAVPSLVPQLPGLGGILLALPSQSFCLPSLEGNGSEAQVSKVE